MLAPAGDTDCKGDGELKKAAQNTSAGEIPARNGRWAGILLKVGAVPSNSPLPQPFCEAISVLPNTDGSAEGRIGVNAEMGEVRSFP